MSEGNSGQGGGAPKKKVMIERPPSLAEKVPKKGGIASVDALRRAEDVVAKVAGEFVQTLDAEFKELDQLMQGYRENGSEEVLNQIFRKVHNLRGQGTTMGFPLITQIGSSFCRYMIERDESKPVKPALIEQHLVALQVVLRENRGQETDGVAGQVANALDIAVAKEISGG